MGYPSDVSFSYCPFCAAREPSIRDERELRCAHCGGRFFFNTAAAAGAFLFKERDLVLCIRGQEPGLDLLDVPGGFIEFGESVEAGLRREIAEELGLFVDALEYLTSEPNQYPFSGVLYRTLDLFFVGAVPAAADLYPDDDVKGICLVDPLKLDPERFAFASTKAAFLTLRDRLREGSLPAVRPATGA